MDLFASGGNDMADFEDDGVGDMSALFGDSEAPAASGAYSGHGVAPDSPRVGKYVGLLNQGATCYLNSLIVTLYMTPEVRRGLFSLTEADLVVPLSGEALEAALRAERDAEEKRRAGPPVDPVALESLLAMGFQEEQIKRAIRKFPSDPDNMQRVEFILSGDADVEPPAPAAPVSAEPTRAHVKERRIPKELQALFARMQACDANAAQSTKRLTDCFGPAFSGGIQHDVHELNRILFDRIEKQLRATPVQGLISDLYRGTVVNRILCKSCGHKSERVEDFLDLSLVVGDFANVEESLLGSVQDEELKDDNMYECSGCNKKVEALKGVRIRSLPPIMILSLSRFEYEKQTYQRVKNSKSFPFPMALDMGRYLENPEDGRWYDLFGVVIHRGEHASHGHYHAYLLDVLNETGSVGAPSAQVLGEGQVDGGAFVGWFDFNDATVRPISVETVQSQFGGAANKAECAYMLVYRERSSPLLQGRALPELPAHLAAALQSENDELRRKRALWEEMRNKIELVLYTTSMFEGRDAEVFLTAGAAGGGKGKEDADDEDEVDAFPSASGAPAHNLMRPVTVLIDRRQTLGDLKRRAVEIFGDLVPAIGDVQVHRIRFLGNERRLKFVRPLDRPMAPDGKEVECDDTAILDSLSTVTHGCEVLVWDGVHLLGDEPFEVCYDLITLVVTFYDDLDKARKYDVHIKEGASLGTLCGLIREREGLAPDQPLILFRQDFSAMAELDDETKTLRELYLHDHSKVCAERRVEGAVETRAASALRASEEARSVFVTNNCDATVVSDAVRCNVGMSIWELKNLIIRRIGTLNERVPMRLRRTNVGGGEGALFSDESASLRKAGVEDNVRVIIEYGEPPDATAITVKYLWGTAAGVRLVQEMRSTCVEVTMPLKQLKALIMAGLSLQGSPEAYRLRKTDFWGNQKDIYDDEERTIKAVGIKDSDVVWIEEGAVPPKGMLELQVELQTSCWDDPDRDEAALARKAADIWNTVAVGTISTLRSATLSSLREQIRKDPVLGGLVGRDKAFRIWCRGKLLRGEDKSLKKLAILSSGTVSLHVLSGPEVPELETDKGGVLLYLRQRLPDSKTFSAPLETVLPAQRRAFQYLVRRGDLLQHITQRCRLAPEDRLLVAKLVTSSGRWRVIVDPFEEHEMVDMSAAPIDQPPQMGVRALHKKQTERKKSDEIFFTDGDLILWKRIADDPDGHDDMLNLLNRTYGDAYVAKSTSGSASSAEPRQRPKEIGLQIDDDGW